jgi:putative uridylyltransferase
MRKRSNRENVLKKLKQEHLLKIFKKEEIAKKIKFFSLKNLEKQNFYFLKGEDLKKKFFKKFLKNIKPLKKVQNYSLKYEKIGRKIILKGEVGIVILAAGMGTRLKSKEPKGFFEINKKSLFSHFFEKIKKEEKKYGRKFYVAIMSSSNNHDKIIEFFEKNRFFGLLKKQINFFMQKDLPFLDKNGKWIVDKKNKNILKGPDGNGGFFESFRENLLKKFEKRKIIKYLSLNFIDNPIFNPLDPVFIGFHKSQKKEISVIAIDKKYKKEKLGVFIEKNKKIRILEYIDIEKIKNKNFKYFNTGIFCIDLDFINKKFDLPLHHVKKRIGKNFFFKSEKLMLDILNFSSSAVICYPREKCYFSLKDFKDKKRLEKILKK